MPRKNTCVYEGLFLVSNEAANKDLEALIASIKEILAKNDSRVLSIYKWDERKLAFEIKGNKRGTYILAYFTVHGGKLQNINRDFNLSGVTLRHLIVNDADEILPRHTDSQIPSKEGLVEEAIIVRQQAKAEQRKNELQTAEAK